MYEERLGFYSCTVPTFEQYLLAELIGSGELERHINRVRRSLHRSAVSFRGLEVRCAYVEC